MNLMFYKISINKASETRGGINKKTISIRVSVLMNYYIKQTYCKPSLILFYDFSLKINLDFSYLDSNFQSQEYQFQFSKNIETLPLEY